VRSLTALIWIKTEGFFPRRKRLIAIDALPWASRGER
jgi:hypothetical protein